MYITGIHLRNIRGFKNLNLELVDGSGNARMHTTIIGTNGTCKTSLLRAISLGLCERDQANALIAEPVGRFTTEGSRSSTITLLLGTDSSKGDKQTLQLQRRDERDIIVRQTSATRRQSSFFVCGYGIGRVMEGPESGRPYQIIDSVYTLFRYDQPLIDIELTLRRLRDYLGTRYYNTTLGGIKRALGLSDEDRIELEKG